MSFLDRIFKRTNLEIDKQRLPQHIAIIMDGNGRWAKKRGMPRNVGHRQGSNTLKKIVEYCDGLGIQYLTVYAFSTENWKRPKSEVDTLMALLQEYLKKAPTELAGKTVRIRVIGDVSGLPPEVQREVENVTRQTGKNTGLTLNIALNYGSREEILSAVKEIVKDTKAGKLKAEELDEKYISEKLYTSGIPDPDLLIRTSGEKRISNFLLWQIAYTEFWYTKVLWPDFSKQELMEAIQAYQNRDRRFGGV